MASIAASPRQATPSPVDATPLTGSPPRLNGIEAERRRQTLNRLPARLPPPDAAADLFEPLLGEPRFFALASGFDSPSEKAIHLANLVRVIPKFAKNDPVEQAALLIEAGTHALQLRDNLRPGEAAEGIGLVLDQIANVVARPDPTDAVVPFLLKNVQHADANAAARVIGIAAATTRTLTDPEARCGRLHECLGTFENLQQKGWRQQPDLDFVRSFSPLDMFPTRHHAVNAFHHIAGIYREARPGLTRGDDDRYRHPLQVLLPDVGWHPEAVSAARAEIRRSDAGWRMHAAEASMMVGLVPADPASARQQLGAKLKELEALASTSADIDGDTASTTSWSTTERPLEGDDVRSALLDLRRMAIAFGSFSSVHRIDVLTERFLGERPETPVADQ